MREKFKESIKGVLIILAAILVTALIIALVILVTMGLDAIRIEWFKFLWNRG